MDAKLIFDVGAHKGEDTDFYLEKGFRVVSVEANAQLAQGLRERFATALVSGRLTIVEAAVAEHEGEIEFFQNEDVSVWGTIYPNWAERNAGMGTRSIKVKVRAVTFDSLLREHGIPYFLKVDIEGADMLCVSALESVSTKPRFVSVEATKTSWKNLVAEFNVFRRLGYTRFKVVNQSYVEHQIEPSPAREGDTTGHRVLPDSSGLFGRDLPDPWLTRSQALRKYFAIFAQYRFFGDNTWGNKMARRLPWKYQRRILPDWYDTHAARP